MLRRNQWNTITKISFQDPFIIRDYKGILVSTLWVFCVTVLLPCMYFYIDILFIRSYVLKATEVPKLTILKQKNSSGSIIFVISILGQLTYSPPIFLKINSTINAVYQYLHTMTTKQVQIVLSPSPLLLSFLCELTPSSTI